MYNVPRLQESAGASVVMLARGGCLDAWLQLTGMTNMVFSSAAVTADALHMKWGSLITMHTMQAQGMP
jgi:hypothetical protein